MASIGIKWLIGVAIVIVVSVAGLSATGTAEAAGPSISGSSCGQLLSAGPVSDYCTYETDGTNVVIGPNSCNVVDACTGIGNAVKINAGGSPSGDGSCNGDQACYYTGYDGGISNIGAGSCNDFHACSTAGAHGGSSAIGNGSCNGDHVCGYAGATDGSSVIGDGSCIGAVACSDVGDTNGTSRIGDGSCIGDHACNETGYDGGSSVLETVPA